MQKVNMMYSTEVYVIRVRKVCSVNALLPSHRRNIYIIESGRAVRGEGVMNTQAKGKKVEPFCMVMDGKPNLQHDITRWTAKCSLRLVHIIIPLLSGEA